MIVIINHNLSSTNIHSIIQELKPKLQLLQLSLSRVEVAFLFRATRVTLAYVLVSSYSMQRNRLLAYNIDTQHV